jgi:uncharacterized membrane protein
MTSNRDRQVDRATDFDETDGEDRGRFLAFSDGVFAFAATLLVVSLAAPALHSGQLSRLPGELTALWPQALAYAISFLVVTSYWGAHRQLFRQIPRLDDVLTGMNAVLLLLIAALPFPSSVLGLYSSQPIAVALYAVTLTAIGLVLFGIRSYALSKGLLRHHATPRAVRAGTLRSLSYPAVFATSVPLAYASSPNRAMYFWLLLIPLNVLLDRYQRGRPAENDQQPPAPAENGND